MDWYRWKPYVPVAKRRQQAAKKMAALRKRGVEIQPIEIEGRTIARTFWGKAWCEHLEGFSDYANRLPRGRTYVRNGSVCHLAITEGRVEANVSGSSLYAVRVHVKALSSATWRDVKRRCSGQIGSLLELLRGDLSDNIMEVVTDRQHGLFPLPGEMSFTCDCPDWARMCKHVAAVLYGIGARLDHDPALLFRLRGVNHDELIDVDAQVAVPNARRRSAAKRLAADDLGDVFGIELATDGPEEAAKGARMAKRKPGKRTPTKSSPSVKTKEQSKRSTRKGAKKVAARRKKATKAARTTPASKASEETSTRQPHSKTPSKRTATRKPALKKSAKKSARVKAKKKK